MSGDERQSGFGLSTLRRDGMIDWARRRAQALFRRSGERVALTWGFVPLLLIAVASLLLAYGNREYNDLVAHTLEIRSRAYQLLTLVQDVETGQRSYLLTGDPVYLDRYRTGVGASLEALDRLQGLTMDNPRQQNEFTVLRRSLEARLDVAARTVALYQQGDTGGALDLVRSDRGRVLMNAIRASIDRIQAEEQGLLTRHSATAGVFGLLLLMTSLCGIALVIGIAALSAYRVRRDTAALQALQGELRAANENLEGIVAARVAELNAANEEIQRFAYIVSHDLRAPLVNVMGFTSELDVLREQIAAFYDTVTARAPELADPAVRIALEEDLPEALRFIRTSTVKMDRLIGAILRLSREGRRVLTPEPVDMREVIGGIAGSLKHQLDEQAVNFEIGSTPGLVTDRLAVEQIFSNLIENAVKYLDASRPGKVTVKGRNIGPEVRYEITDNGRGIEARDFERIFDLFRRAGMQDRPGEGIGLAHVRAMIRRLGGSITVTSQPGQGSTFTVTLPSILTTQNLESP